MLGVCHVDDARPDLTDENESAALPTFGVVVTDADPPPAAGNPQLGNAPVCSGMSVHV